MSDTSTNPEMPESGTVGRWLFNPFYYIAGGKSLIIGIAVMLITGLFANLGGFRFNGLLDFHLGFSGQPWWINISEILISWLILSSLLLISGKLVSKSRVRSIDVFGTQALARSPYLFVSLAAIIPGMHRFAEKLITDQTALPQFSPGMILFIFVSIFIILMAVWMVALMYRAFSVSCNVVGKTAVSVFIISLLVGEILSLVAFHYGGQVLPDQTPGLSARGSEFVTLLSEGEYARIEKMFDAKMKAALPAEKIQEVWQSITARFGAFRKQGIIRKTRLMGYDVVYVPCRFEKRTLDAKIVFNREGIIAGLFFVPSGTR